MKPYLNDSDFTLYNCDVLEGERAIAWAAGLFEGEGCFTASGREAALTAALTSTDRDVVERFAEIVGCGSIGTSKRRRAHWKDKWTWQANGESAVKVGELLLPYLGERRTARFIELRDRRAKRIAHATRERTCPECGTSFRPRLSPRAAAQVYCSPECYEQVKRRARLVPRPARTCGWCGEPLEPNAWPTKRYCSQSHKSMAFQARRANA